MFKTVIPRSHLAILPTENKLVEKKAQNNDLELWCTFKLHVNCRNQNGILKCIKVLKTLFLQILASIKFSDGKNILNLAMAMVRFLKFFMLLINFHQKMFRGQKR